MSTADLLKDWMRFAKTDKSREEMIKEYGVAKDDFLERMKEFLSPEDLERIQQMPDNTYFWPTSMGDAQDTADTMVTVPVTFEYERIEQWPIRRPSNSQ